MAKKLMHVSCVLAVVGLGIASSPLAALAGPCEDQCEQDYGTAITACDAAFDAAVLECESEYNSAVVACIMESQYCEYICDESLDQELEACMGDQACIDLAYARHTACRQSCQQTLLDCNYAAETSRIAGEAAAQNEHDQCVDIATDAYYSCLDACPQGADNTTWGKIKALFKE